jgi:fatty acid desaturase
MEKPTAFRLKASELLPLSARSNLPALRRSAGHLGAICITAFALWQLRHTAWALLLVPALGFMLAFLFNVVHEMAHQTAFKTRAGNYFMGHLASFVILLPYEYYRAFHWDHHRYTQDLARDPELSRRLPRAGWKLAWYWTGIPTWIDRCKMLWVHGVEGRVDKPWVAAGKRGLIAREARLYLIGYGLVAGISIATASTAVLWLWVLPVMVGQWFLRPYLLAEHTGCAHSPDMLENTRTTHTNALVRFFAWNMPYHVEHHAYPAVPFHALPKLNRILAERITHTAPGYVAATAEVLRYLNSPGRLVAEQAAQAGNDAVTPPARPSPATR